MARYLVTIPMILALAPLCAATRSGNSKSEQQSLNNAAMPARGRVSREATKADEVLQPADQLPEQSYFGNGCTFILAANVAAFVLFMYFRRQSGGSLLKALHDDDSLFGGMLAVPLVQEALAVLGAGAPAAQCSHEPEHAVLLDADDEDEPADVPSYEAGDFHSALPPAEVELRSLGSQETSDLLGMDAPPAPAALAVCAEVPKVHAVNTPMAMERRSPSMEDLNLDEQQVEDMQAWIEAAENDDF